MEQMEFRPLFSTVCVKMKAADHNRFCGYVSAYIQKTIIRRTDTPKENYHVTTL